MTPIEISAGALRQSADQMTTAISGADATMDAFEGQLSSHGEPWGNDDLGSVIGEIYKGAHAMIMNCINSNLDTMDGYAQRLGAAADNYDDADMQASQRMTSIQAGRGPAMGL